MAQQINLFDQDLRPQRHRLTPGRLLLLLGLLVAGLALLAQVWQRQAAQDRAQALALQRQAQALGAGAQAKPTEDSELPRLRRELAEARALAAALAASPEAAPEQAARVLAALSAATAPGVWLQSVQWQAAPRQLALEGALLQAPQLPAYLRRLEAQPAFRGLGFAQLQLAPPPQPPGQAVGAAGAAPTHSVFALRSQPKETGR